MRESIAAFCVALPVSTLPLQLIGFFTPFWACGEYTGGYNTGNVTKTNVTCDVKGVFYTCKSQCNIDVLETNIFALSLASLVITCVTALMLLRHFHKKMLDAPLIEWELSFNNAETWYLVVFIIGQLLAGVAAFMILLKYAFISWSAIVFATLAIPVFAIAFSIFTLLVACCLCQCIASADDD